MVDSSRRVETTDVLDFIIDVHGDLNSIYQSRYSVILFGDRTDDNSNHFLPLGIYSESDLAYEVSRLQSFRSDYRYVDTDTDL